VPTAEGLCASDSRRAWTRGHSGAAGKTRRGPRASARARAGDRLL